MKLQKLNKGTEHSNAQRLVTCYCTCICFFYEWIARADAGNSNGVRDMAVDNLVDWITDIIIPD